MGNRERTMENLEIAHCYAGKKVLVTGHSGFKGSWLVLLLERLGAKVSGLSLAPNPVPDALYYTEKISSRLEHEVFGDIREAGPLCAVVNENAPDFIFHFAAQPLVRHSYAEPLPTYATNVMGTANLLEAVRLNGKTMTCILATSDKCHENKGKLWSYRENESMGGHDPYSSSKGCCELLISSWRNSFFNAGNYNAHRKSVASVRAGNVIGGGDYAADRIIPDIVRAVRANLPVRIRDPHSIRPWQHVLDCLWGYLFLGAHMYGDPLRYSEGWNFGPDPESYVTVRELVEIFTASYGKGAAKYAEYTSLHEADLLTLDSTKARQHLGWKPVLNLRQALEFTARHYREPGCAHEQLNFFLEHAQHGRH